jgi:hypothetical protein
MAHSPRLGTLMWICIASSSVLFQRVESYFDLCRMETVEIAKCPSRVDFKFSEGKAITTTPAVISRSPILHDALKEAAECAPIALVVGPAGYLAAWLHYIGATTALHEGRDATDSLLTYLKVC